MANKEHLKILRLGASEWNKWREVNPNVEPDFKEAILDRVLLKGANLQQANLQNADLQKANLQQANLQSADFQKANLRQANLQNADLQGADLKKTYLKGVNLQKANLKEANLENAIIEGASLQEANFYKANLNMANLISKLQRTCFFGASLYKAILNGADLWEADLRHANLQYANLRYAELQEADLRYSDLQNANLCKSDLRGADLQEANLQGANLEYSKFRGANFKGAVIRYIDLLLANLQDADFSRDVDLLNADLQNVNNRDATQNDVVYEYTRFQVDTYLYKTVFRNEYTDNGNGTVTDNLTGLMWKETASSKYMKFKDVQGYIDELNRKKFTEYSDWRLPTLEELAPLTESEKLKEYIYFCDDFQQVWYWTADKRESGNIWAVDFRNNQAICLHAKNTYAWVRAVRSCR